MAAAALGIENGKWALVLCRVWAARNAEKYQKQRDAKQEKEKDKIIITSKLKNISKGCELHAIKESLS